MVRRLLEEENVSMDGRFHQLRQVTSLPRPTQLPRPPFWLAALATPSSFERAGRLGYDIMAIPLAGGQMADLIGCYRDARRAAGHPGPGRVMLAFPMFCAADDDHAVQIARDPLNAYLTSLVDAASDWLHGQTSADYPNYDRIIAALAEETFETQREKGAAWVGTPDMLVQQIREYQGSVGGFEVASLQVNFNVLAREEAEASLRLFAEHVMPACRRL